MMLPDTVPSAPCVWFPPPAVELTAFSWTAIASPPTAAALPMTSAGSATAGSTMLPESVEATPLVCAFPPAVAEVAVAHPAPERPSTPPALQLTETGPATAGSTTVPAAVAGSPEVIT